MRNCCSFYSHPRFLAVYLALARRYNLPLRMAPRRQYEQRGVADMYDQLPLAELLHNDDMRAIALHDPPALKGQLLEILRTLEPGVTELVLHAALPTAEAQAIMRDWPARAEAHRLMADDADVRHTLDEQGIIRIGWRALRDAQRAGS